MNNCSVRNVKGSILGQRKKIPERNMGIMKEKRALEMIPA